MSADVKDLVHRLDTSCDCPAVSGHEYWCSMMPSKLSREAAVAIRTLTRQLREAVEERDRLRKLLMAAMNMLVLPGHAMSRADWDDACLRAGRYVEPFLSALTERSEPPAPASIAPELLQRVRSLLCAVIDAEPGDMAADGVTVLDVWRKECDALLAALTERSNDDA